MGRLTAALVVVLFATAARPDAQVDLAMRALRTERSMKVRAQAAIVLGQRRIADAVPALCEAVEQDEAIAVRLAAVSALGRIGDPAAESTLQAASRRDPDPQVRAAAARALRDLAAAAPSLRVVSIEEPSGSAGGPRARDALRAALAKHLTEAGFSVVARGGVRLKPSVVRVDIDATGGKTVFAVRASLVAVERDGRMAAMLESGARLSATGALADDKRAAYSARALDAAARILSEDLAAKLAER
jgi:HEAT repeat protein